MKYVCPFCYKVMPQGYEPSGWQCCGEVGHATIMPECPKCGAEQFSLPLSACEVCNWQPMQVLSITDYVRSYWTKLLGDSMTTVTTEELETIRELRQQRDELMKVLRQADCACSLRERDSGHVIGCWKPDVDAALAKMKP